MAPLDLYARDGGFALRRGSPHDARAFSPEGTMWFKCRTARNAGFSAPVDRPIGREKTSTPWTDLFFPRSSQLLLPPRKNAQTLTSQPEHPPRSRPIPLCH